MTLTLAVGRFANRPMIAITSMPTMASPFFDPQASSFDQRAGLPDEAAKAVAGGLAALCPAETWLVEVGAGTGGIGRRLIGSAGTAAGDSAGTAGTAAGDSAGTATRRYVGVDLSVGMLARFRAGSAASLVAGDANRPWPLASGSAGLVFLSRAAHLLDAEHLLNEFRRVAHPAGAWFVLGRVRRQSNSPRARIRQEMHRRLALRGLPRREGRGAEQALLDALVAWGGILEAPRAVATWTVTERVSRALSSWRGKPGLAGTALLNPLRDQILTELEAWALETFGSLESERENIESYELAAARLPATPPKPMNPKEPA